MVYKLLKRWVSEKGSKGGGGRGGEGPDHVSCKNFRKNSCNMCIKISLIGSKVSGKSWSFHQMKEKNHRSHIIQIAIHESHMPFCKIHISHINWPWTGVMYIPLATLSGIS